MGSRFDAGQRGCDMNGTLRGGICALSLLAASLARADDASRLKLARDIVVMTHAADTMRKLLPTMMAQLRPMLQQQGAADAKAVDDFLKEASARFDQQADRFADLAAQVYAREFAEDDLNNLRLFYETPTGQRFLSKQGEIAQAMVLAGQQWGGMIAKQVIEDFRKKAAAPPKL